MHTVAAYRIASDAVCVVATNLLHPERAHSRLVSFNELSKLTGIADLRTEHALIRACAIACECVHIVAGYRLAFVRGKGFCLCFLPMLDGKNIIIALLIRQILMNSLSRYPLRRVQPKLAQVSDLCCACTVSEVKFSPYE
jgi:hypothetical protein